MDINSIKEMYNTAADNKEFYDGHHSMKELYFNRMLLTLVIAHTYPESCYKSKLHDDGTMFDDSFIITFETPEGDYSYHYNIKYWDLFEIEERPKAYYDGHKPNDIGRLLSLIEDNSFTISDGIKEPKLLTPEELFSHTENVMKNKPKRIVDPNEFCEENFNGSYDL